MTPDMLEKIRGTTADLPQVEEKVAPVAFNPPDVQGSQQEVGKSLTELTGKTAKVLNEAYTQSEIAGSDVFLAKNYQRLRDEQADNPTLDSQHKFETNWNGLISGYLPTLSFKARDEMAKRAAMYGLQGSEFIGNKVRELSKNIKEENLMESLETQSTQARIAAYSGATVAGKDGTQVPISHLAALNVQNNLDANVATGIVSGAYAAHAKRALLDDVQEYGALGQFNRMLESNKLDTPQKVESVKKYLQDFQSDNSIDPLIKMRVMPKLREMFNTYKEKITGADEDLEHQKIGLRAGIESGAYNLSSPQTTQLLTQFDLKGKGQEARDDLVASQVSHDTAQSVYGLNPSQQESVIEQSKPKPSDDLRTAYIKNYAVDKTQEAVKQEDKLFNEDPGAWAQKLPAFTRALEARKVAASDANGNKVPGSTTPPIDPFEVTLRAELARGALFPKVEGHAQVSLFPKSRALDIVGQVNSSINPETGLPDVSAQHKIVAGVLNSFQDPGLKEIVAHDLEKSGLPYANTIFEKMVNTGSPYQQDAQVAFSHDLSYWKPLMESKDLSETKVKNQIMTSPGYQMLANSINPMNADGQQVLNNFINNTAKLAMQIYPKEGSNAFKVAASIPYADMQPGSYNGGAFMFPKTVNDSRLKDALDFKIDSLRNSDITINDESFTHLPQEKRQALAKTLNSKNGTWQMTSDMSGLQLVDATSGRSPILANGKPVVVSFSQADTQDSITNPQSKLNQDILKWKTHPPDNRVPISGESILKAIFGG